MDTTKTHMTATPLRPVNSARTSTLTTHDYAKDPTMFSPSINDELDGALPDRGALPPDSPRPPGEDVGADECDDSLAARAPVARCADGNGTLTALFFSDNVVDIARAKAMCGLCPLAADCLASAIEREEPWGVWGGELISGGRVVANKRPCGRPPKNPRPEVIYDEMGPVDTVPVVSVA